MTPLLISRRGGGMGRGPPLTRECHPASSSHSPCCLLIPPLPTPSLLGWSPGLLTAPAWQLLVFSCLFPACSPMIFWGFLFTTVLFSVEAFTHAVPTHPSPPHHQVLSHLSLNFQGSPSMNFTPESSVMVSLSTCPSVGTHFNLSL